jgi:pimeloyl-ACP methyl ester carboxylesterase
MKHVHQPGRLKVVLVPGLLCDASIWKHLKKTLTAFADVDVFDTSKDASINDMAQALLKSQCGPITLIGHSMGGRVALEVAWLAPDRVPNLILLDTGAHPRTELEYPRRRQLVDLAFDQGMEALAQVWLPPMVHPARIHDHELMAELKAMVMRATPEQHLLQITALLNRPNALEYLSRIKCPTLIIVGRQDQWSTLAQHEEMAKRIPDSELAVIEDCGHMSIAERPEVISRVVLRWLGLTDHTETPISVAGGSDES